MTRARGRADDHLNGGGGLVSRIEIVLASTLVAWFYVSGFAAAARWVARHL